MKRLFISDFDDTLAHSEIPIYVRMKNGNRISLTPHQFAKHNLKPGDFYDFSEFNKLIKGATPIKRNVELLRKAMADTNNKVTILTARALAYPVSYWLKTMTGLNSYVVALGNPNPELKKAYIEKEIQKGKYDSVFFIDDSDKNIKAVDTLKDKYPEINIETELVKPEIMNANTLKEAIKKMVKEELTNYSSPMYMDNDEDDIDYDDTMDWDYSDYYDDLDTDDYSEPEYSEKEEDEDCGCEDDEIDDHEGSMAKSDLASLSELAAEINDMIDPDDELEGWVQAKITKAADYIEAVHKYMKYDY